MNRPAKILAVFFISFLWAQHALCAQNFAAKPSGKITIEKPRETFRVGERFDYAVYWMGIHVGWGTLQVKEIADINGRDAYHVVCTARSNEFLSNFYKVEDVIHSYIDVEKMCSLRFEKHQREGKYKSDEIIIYDQKRHKGFYESALNKTKKEFDIPPGVHDITSAFYCFRTMDVRPGQTAVMDINADEKNWKARFKVTHAESLELRNRGVHDVIVVEPEAGFRAVIAKKSRAWVYFSADKDRVPVCIKIRVPFGYVRGILDKKE